MMLQYKHKMKAEYHIIVQVEKLCKIHGLIILFKWNLKL
jgi:hypothetical protein